MKILLTGATGLVGGALAKRLSDSSSYLLTAANRRLALLPKQVSQVQINGVDAQTDWQTALQNVDVVVHAAARVHVMQDTAQDPLVDFREVNVRGTLNLARQAHLSGVKRLVYISSIKVNGELTLPGQGFSEGDSPAPAGPYAISKYEAETSLVELATKTGMEVVIIRPPLIYGPGVKANFLSMMRWLYRGVPLPLGAIDNRRSLVALDNLVDLIMTCIEHPAAANEIFLAGDGEDMSTTELLHRMGYALGRPARLMPVPVWMLQAAATLVGRRSMALRLCGSLQVDIGKAHKLLGWYPPVSVDQAIQETAKRFLELQSQ